MKKLLATMLISGVLALTACQPATLSAGDSDSKLKSNGYSTQLYTYEEAKVLITGLNYEVKFSNAISAEKGSGDNKDLFIGFYFSSIGDAEKFYSNNNYENLGILNNYAERNLGANLKKRVGMHNNVVFAGSETSFSAAF